MSIMMLRVAADRLMDDVRTTLPDEDYERLLRILVEWNAGTLSRLAAEYMIEMLLSTDSVLCADWLVYLEYSRRVDACA